jgi:hypothetical protein
VEGGLVTDHIEVGVPARHCSDAVALLDRTGEVLERVGRSAREALGARHVVEQQPLSGCETYWPKPEASLQADTGRAVISVQQRFHWRPARQ